MIPVLHQTVLPHLHPHVEAVLLAALAALLLGLAAVAMRKFRA